MHIRTQNAVESELEAPKKAAPKPKATTARNAKKAKLQQLDPLVSNRHRLGVLQALLSMFQQGRCFSSL